MDDNYKRKLRERDRKNELRRQAVIRQRIILGAAAGLILLVLLGTAVKGCGNKKEKIQEEKKAEQQKKEEKKPEIVTFTVSAAGDCTLGTDAYFNPATSFTTKYEEVNNPAYFFEKVKPIFADDDLTIVNMEGTLTEETTRADKRFAFKADPEYAKILTEGSVEAANFANNHCRDYGEKSYTDTIAAMDAEGIVSFGEDRTAIMDIKGIKVGLLGTNELPEHMGCEEEMIKNIESLKEQGAQVIIASFHWGIERDNMPNDTQKKLAHSAIDNGVDLVLGHHPHVLQGIEEYKGKNIVYSLGNFCFGGNSGPKDMDAMIFQQTFTLEDGKLKEDNVNNIIPCKISSSYEKGRNDYQPMPAEGDVKDAIMERIEEYSKPLNPVDEVEGAAVE